MIIHILYITKIKIEAMLKYDEFKNKKKQIENQEGELKRKLVGLKKKKIQVKLAQFNKKENDIRKSMNKYVNGASNY